MKLHYWVIALGVYMVLMSIVGYIRTGSPTAIFINGSFAIVTIVLGLFLGRNPQSVIFMVTLVWAALLTVIMAYMTFKRVAAHANVKAGSEYIFGSMAVFALIVTILLIRHRFTM